METIMEAKGEKGGKGILLRVLLPFCYPFVTGATSISFPFYRCVTGVTVQRGEGGYAIRPRFRLPRRSSERRRDGPPQCVDEGGCSSSICPTILRPPLPASNAN